MWIRLLSVWNTRNVAFAGVCFYPEFDIKLRTDEVLLSTHVKGSCEAGGHRRRPINTAPATEGQKAGSRDGRLMLWIQDFNMMVTTAVIKCTLEYVMNAGYRIESTADKFTVFGSSSPHARRGGTRDRTVPTGRCAF